MNSFSADLTENQIYYLLNELGIAIPDDRMSREWSTISSPFREDKNPSFAINIATGGWIDHGTNEKGDIINLVEKQTGLMNGEAIKWTKEKLNLTSKVHVSENENTTLDFSNSTSITDLKSIISEGRETLIATEKHELLSIAYKYDGLQKNTLIEYGVGIYNRFGSEWLAFPYSTGCQLYRRENDKKIISAVTGSEPKKTFFGITQITNKKELYIAKSPRECMLLNQKYGYKVDVIGLCSGEVGTLSDEQANWLTIQIKRSNYRNIYTFLDGDTESAANIAMTFSTSLARIAKKALSPISVYCVNVHKQTSLVSKDVTEAFDLGMEDELFFAMLEDAQVVMIQESEHWFNPLNPLEMDVKPVDFIVEGYCARGLITLIGGSAGSGKSMLNQFLFQSRSNQLLNTKSGKAIYLTGADASDIEVARRARAIGDNNGLQIVNLPDSLLCTATNQQFINDLLTQVQEHNIDALIFDTLADFHTGSLFDPEFANDTMKGFTLLARVANVAIIIITHTRKGSKTKSNYNVEDISDSRIFTTKSDFVFGLRSEYQEGLNLIELQCLKSRSAKPMENLRAEIFSDEENGQIFIYPSDKEFQLEIDNRNVSQTRERLVNEVKRLHEEGKSYRAIADEVGISKSAVGNYLKN